MSFLAPLYLLGGLLVSLPVFFHLIRRTPRGRVRFSSLMFLSPSPPRITRRSRLDNWLLLLLRAVVLCLLALAFARPFLRETSLLSLHDAGRRVAILVDTSASMRRGDLWSRAVEKAGAVLDDTKPSDQVALFTFDESVREVIGFDDDIEVPARQRPALMKRRLASVSPTWAATDLGGALVTVADALDMSRDRAAPDGNTASERALQIVLVTDLQRGSQLEALSAYSWPDRVRLTVERLSLPETSNAGFVLLKGSDPAVGDPPESDSPEAGSTRRRRRVRVVNEALASRDQFSLRWANASQDRFVDAVTSVYVPAGESRVVSALEPADGFPADRLVLNGDDHDFDNTIHVVPPRRGEIEVLYVGGEAADDPQELRYYVAHALAVGRSDVRFVPQAPDRPLPPAAKRPPRLAIVTVSVGDAVRQGLASYVRSGGTVLYVARDASVASSVGALLECEDLAAEEVDGSDYAMLGEIDFSHPFFASFADPRFNDFTTIRFWRHRRFTWDATRCPEVRVLARFDDGDPALVEKLVGKGRVLVLTSGWHPRDSQLALSTKFVPLMAGLIEDRPGARGVEQSFHVGDAIPVPPALKGARRKVRKPDGTEPTLAPADETFDDTDQPGIYELEVDGETWRFAVNLSPSESQTAPLPVESLEQRGARLGVSSAAEDRRRQMLDLELESSQKLWSWVVAAVLGLLILETWLAARLGRSLTEREATE